MIKIDHDIPIPPRFSGPRRPPTYPFSDLAVGDSFAIPADGGKLASAAVKWKARHVGWDYRTMRDGDLVRLWRVA